MSEAADHTPDLRLAAIGGPLVLATTLTPAILLLASADRLPPTIARHWDLSGTVTGTWSLSAAVWVPTLLGGLVAFGLLAVGVASREPPALRRALAGAGVWTSTLLGATGLDVWRLHLEVPDSTQVPAPTAGLALGATVGVALGALAAWAVTVRPSATRLADRPPPTSLPRHDGALPFCAPVPFPAGLRGALLVAGALLTLPALAGAAGPAVLGLVVVLPLLLLTSWTVQLDHDGLQVRTGPVRWLDVPIAEIAQADVEPDLHGFWEFGGVGLRRDVQGRTGVVGRRGPALRVTLGDASQVLVTLEDAETAAGLLNAAADRHHRQR